MILIYPPVAKPCEAPAGIAKLAGAFSAYGIPCTTLDANIEGLLHLAMAPRQASDTWTRRAVKNVLKNIAALRDIRLYQSPGSYNRAVRDVQRVLAVAAGKHDALLGLADYQDHRLSPLRSTDLIQAAEYPEYNPYYPYFKNKLPELIQKNTSAFVGFSLNYLSQALCTFSMIGFIRKQFPSVKIVLGGGLISTWLKKREWQNPFIGLVDTLIAGPGESPLLSLFGVNGEENRHMMPDYDGLPTNDYLSPGFILPYSGSSGCYWKKCSFCPETAENIPYVPIPAELARADINALTIKTKPVLVHMLDSAISPALMRNFATKPLGIPWYGFARISKDLLDLNYCTALQRSGCVMLSLGLESGDQGVLDRMCKGTDLATASQVLRNLKQAGIATYIYLLFGTPYETIQEARRTLDFVVRHADAISFLNLAIFNLPICGQDAEKYETEYFYGGDLSLYTGFRHPNGWNRKKVRHFLNAEFKRNVAVSRILKKDPPIFTSNHSAFFVNQ